MAQFLQLTGHHLNLDTVTDVAAHPGGRLGVRTSDGQCFDVDGADAERLRDALNERLRSEMDRRRDDWPSGTVRKGAW